MLLLFHQVIVSISAEMSYVNEVKHLYKLKLFVGAKEIKIIKNIDTAL